MAKPIIAIKIRIADYAGLVNLGNRVFVSMTGNANYTTPSPTLVALQTSVTDVENAIAAWGPKGNRGSHADLVDLRQKALTLSQQLKSMAQYVQNTAQIAAGSDYVSMGAIITTSGFSLAIPRSVQGRLEMVQNFHNFVSRQINANQVKLKWKKPLNTATAGNVKSYTVYRGPQTTGFNGAEVIGSTTKTSWIDTNNGDMQRLSYWVVPVGAAGDGVVSDVVNVTLQGGL